MHRFCLHPLTSASDRIPMVIRITPTREGHVAFNLVVTVRRKFQSLTMNVKGECCSMNAHVRYESPEGSITELSSHQIHPVDFKQVKIYVKSVMNAKCVCGGVLCKRFVFGRYPAKKI